MIHPTCRTLNGELIELPTIEYSTAAQKFGKRSKSFCALIPPKAMTQKKAESMILKLGQKTHYLSAGAL